MMHNIFSLLLFLGLIIIGVTGEDCESRKCNNDNTKQPHYAVCSSKSCENEAPCYRSRCESKQRYHDRW